MNSAIPTLEELAQRLQGNLTQTKAFLGHEAELVVDLTREQRGYVFYIRNLSAKLKEDGLIVGKTVSDRAAVKDLLIKGDETSIDYQKVIAAFEERLVRLKANIEALRIERGVLRDLLRIRELYNTAERAAQRQGWQRSPWQRRWRQ